LRCDNAGTQCELEVEVDSVLHRTTGQTVNGLDPSPQMRDSLDIGVTFRRVPASTQPISNPLFDQAGLGAVARQQLRLTLDNLRELAFQGFCNTGVERASRQTVTSCAS
jgi:hypothetical protein